MTDLSTDLRLAVNNEPEFTELDFIANQLYQADHQKRGNPTGARWWCLRDELRKKFRTEARRQYLEWAQSEQFTMERSRGY